MRKSLYKWIALFFLRRLTVKDKWLVLLESDGCTVTRQAITIPDWNSDEPVWFDAMMFPDAMIHVAGMIKDRRRENGEIAKKKAYEKLYTEIRSAVIDAKTEVALNAHKLEPEHKEWLTEQLQQTLKVVDPHK